MLPVRPGPASAPPAPDRSGTAPSGGERPASAAAALQGHVAGPPATGPGADAAGEPAARRLVVTRGGGADGLGNALAEGRNDPSVQEMADALGTALSDEADLRGIAR